MKPVYSSESVCLTVACSTLSEQTDVSLVNMAGVQAEIKKRLDEIRESIKQQKDLSAFYSKDAVILQDAEPPVVGIDAVSKRLKKMYDDESMADFTFDEPSVKAYGDGTTVTSWQLYNLVNKEGKVYFSGKSASVWKKDEATNEWMIELEMSNEGR